MTQILDNRRSILLLIQLCFQKIRQQNRIIKILNFSDYFNILTLHFVKVGFGKIWIILIFSCKWIFIYFLKLCQRREKITSTSRAKLTKKVKRKKPLSILAIIRRMVFDLKSHRRRNMNEQIDNSSPLSLSQALELIKTREGENFSKEKVNLAELQRLTGITRGKLRRLRRTVLQLQFYS